MTHNAMSVPKVNDREPTILGLDVSSTMIGYAIWHDVGVREYGEWALRGSIDERCRQACACLWLLLDRIVQPDVIAIEAPVARFASAVIAQSRVAGALLTLIGEREIAVLEIAPAAAKRVLTGRGGADKALMQAAARQYGVVGEHASDALGVARAARQRVEVIPTDEHVRES